ncbi:hypothetical protein HID58_019717 [Brassica napus]|uniref:Uncharacterized protein n=1 Tax=Brassica napus TaxID=3708 RepID=A0ABQ8DDM8_BRANA|nr:hypothetical protein HID58_019717 [Brassica napus]
MYLELKSEADKCFYLPNSSELMGLNVLVLLFTFLTLADLIAFKFKGSHGLVKVVQGHGCERKSRVCFAVFPFTGLKEVTGVKFHFYK